MIIGITGKKGHGKDTVGEFLRKHGFELTAYANPIKEAVMVALSMTIEQVCGPIEVKEAVDERYGITPRHAMQTLGTEWGRDSINKDVWALAAHARIDDAAAEYWAITDVRFLNEASILRERGGIILKVVRPDTSTGQFEEHSSETELDQIEADIVLYNDGSLQGLEDAVTFIAGALLSSSASAENIRRDGMRIGVTSGRATWMRQPEEEWAPRCGNPHCLGVISSYRDDNGTQNFEKCDDCGRFEYDEDAIAWLHKNLHKLEKRT